jgi:hypothetical protein
MKERFRSARDKVERVKGEVYLAATEQLVTRDSGNHEEFKVDKKKKRK